MKRLELRSLDVPPRTFDIRNEHWANMTNRFFEQLTLNSPYESLDLDESSQPTSSRGRSMQQWAARAGEHRGDP